MATTSYDVWLASQVCTWPEPYRLWAAEDLAGEYPSRIPPPAPAGWQCPSCGSCYSPSTARCWVCPGTADATSVAGMVGVSRRLGPDDPMSDEDYER